MSRTPNRNSPAEGYGPAELIIRIPVPWIRPICLTVAVIAAAWTGVDLTLIP